MFQPEVPVLGKYADLLVKFALNGGQGVRPKQVVQLTVPDTAKPLFTELLRAVLEAGAYPKINFIPTETDCTFFEHATDDQLQRVIDHDRQQNEAQAGMRAEN